jgi:hypothetical protein
MLVGMRVTLVDTCVAEEVLFEGALKPKITTGPGNALHTSVLQFSGDVGYLVSSTLGETEENGLFFTSTPLKEEPCR